MNDQIDSISSTAGVPVGHLSLFDQAIQTDTTMARNRATKETAFGPRPGDISAKAPPQRRQPVNSESNQHATSNEIDHSSPLLDKQRNGLISTSSKTLNANINCKRGGSSSMNDNYDTDSNDEENNPINNNDDDSNDEVNNKDLGNNVLPVHHTPTLRATPVIRDTGETIDEDNIDIDDLSPSTSESTSSVSRSSYMEYLKINGQMMSDDDLRSQVEIILKDHIWKFHKLPDCKDYEYNSTFCNKILTKLNVECKTMNRKAQEIWSRIMPLVKSEYSTTRSTVTQAMKQNFNGT